MKSAKKKNDPIAFAKWIGERMNADKWFMYNAILKTWYIPMNGHITTEKLYEIWLATNR